MSPGGAFLARWLHKELYNGSGIPLSSSVAAQIWPLWESAILSAVVSLWVSLVSGDQK